MNYEDFVEKTKKYPLFGEDLLVNFAESKTSRKLQLNRWVKTGKVIRLKRGLYTLPDDQRKKSLSIPWLANALYSPSYLSLEYMLSFYDLIPEQVHVFTSVSTRKTFTIKNAFGRFTYRTLQQKHFFGFAEIKDELGYPVLMAGPEKCLLDTIYLTPNWEFSADFLFKNLRLQQLESLQKKKLKAFAQRFKSKKIDKALMILLQEMKK